MGSLILVGEAPGGSGPGPHPALATTGQSGRTLAALAGLTNEEYERVFKRLNLFNKPETTRYTSWEFALRAERMSELFIAGDRVILLGTRVARAFGVQNRALFQWYAQLAPSGTFWVALVPHPSGRNRALNDAAVRDQFSAFLREAVECRT